MIITGVETNRKNTKVKGSGIRGQLVLGFTVFVLIVLIIVWVFQVLLLDYFYEQTKLGELNAVHNGIETFIEDEQLDAVCGDLASQYDVCISLYRVVDGELSDLIVTKEVSPTCVIHYADINTLSTYYSNAINSGGSFTQRYNLNPDDNDFSKKKTPKDNSSPDRSNIKYNDLHEKQPFVVAVSVKTISDSQGNSYAAFINLRFTPVNTIQQTRNVQFIYIASVVVLAAIIFALVFSNKIAKPLERMTESAEQMAYGDYSAEFREEGYRETRRLAKTLNYAVDQISKTDKLQRELIANVSHDLRTPLTLISGYSEMMRDIPGENTPENSQLIIDETRRLTTLVNDMLDFSKYSSGFEIPELQIFNLTESVRKSMNRYNELIKLKGYYIDFKYDCEINVYADERMILQVIYNLLNNAINYTGEDKKVFIRQDVEGDNVRISIFDTGKGIPQENITQIWDRYYKVNQSHKRAITGSGLGLSIVSRLLQLHSASYGVESTDGLGSCFWFELKIFNE